MMFTTLFRTKKHVLVVFVEIPRSQRSQQLPKNLLSITSNDLDTCCFLSYNNSGQQS